MSSEAKNTDDLTSEIEKMRKEQNDCESELEKRLKMIQNFIENQAPEVKQNFELYEEKLIEETQAKSELQILSKKMPGVTIENGRSLETEIKSALESKKQLQSQIKDIKEKLDLKRKANSSKSDFLGNKTIQLFNL